MGGGMSKKKAYIKSIFLTTVKHGKEAQKEKYRSDLIEALL